MIPDLSVLPPGKEYYQKLMQEGRAFRRWQMRGSAPKLSVQCLVWQSTSKKAKARAARARA